MSRTLSTSLAALLLFALSFCVFYWPYAYVIRFQSESNDCFFMFGKPFLAEFLDHPGGLLVYAGRFLGQFYHYQWLGAFVASACIVGFAFVYHGIVGRLSGKAHLSQTLIPCLLLLALHTSVLFVLHDTLGLTLSCLAFLAYLSLRQGRPRVLYALLATPALYLVAGVHVWPLVAWILAFEWAARPLRSNLAFKILYPLLSAALPVIAWRWIFLIPLRNAFLCPLVIGVPFRSGSTASGRYSLQLDLALAALLLASMFLIAFWRRLFVATQLADFWKTPPGWGSRLALAAAAVVIGAVLCRLQFDASLANVVACERLYHQRQWDTLLEITKANEELDLRLQFMTNFALWQQGRLLDEMFHYPQPWGTRGLVLNFSGKAGLSPAQDDTVRGMYNSDLFFEMGHINASFRHAYNQTWATGTSYETLQRMALCCMINGNNDLAVKYLSLLERTLFYRPFARRYKTILGDPLANEQELADRRRWLPQIDNNMYGHPTTPLLTAFISHTDNRMAFDCLMAWMLLDKSQRSLGAIAANVGYFRALGYDSIPTHCQEALLILEKTSGAPVDLAGYQYAPEAEQRVDQFLNLLAQHSTSQEILDRIPSSDRNSYLYYFFFATPPASTHPEGQQFGSGGTIREE